MNEELCLCPFCGSGAVIKKAGKRDDIVFAVSCENGNCMASVGWFDSLNVAVESWNKRKTKTKIDTAVKLLKRNYEKALQNKGIKKPLSWALYHTWDETDKKEKGRD